ncbi:MAG: prolipoprotein diacylglyceryl transferase [Desulfobacterales bacterium]
MTWWNRIPFHIDPTLIEIGSFPLRWYGLMYIVAFGIAYGLMRYRTRTEGFGYNAELIQDFMVWAILGVMIGGRLGYVLFYDLRYFAAHPLKIILPVDFSDGFRFTGLSGMSYHGGVIGVLAASIVFCRRRGLSFWAFADFVMPTIPLGYTFGRIGNFINGELYGRVTDVPWAMVFPTDPHLQMRHPSQLYEAFFEGIVLFALLWAIRKKSMPVGAMLPIYLIGYGIVRFFIEFFREPDAHLMFVLGPLSMGQVLCLSMTAAGVILLRYRQTRKPSVNR